MQPSMREEFNNEIAAYCSCTCRRRIPSNASFTLTGAEQMRNVIGNGAVALAASAVLGMASISSANQISVNLGIQGSGNTVTTTAGVSPQTCNWNNDITRISSTGQRVT